MHPTSKKTIDDGTKELQNTNDARVIAVYIFYGIMMCVPLLGFLSWLCGKAFLSYIMTQITFCMLFTAWLFFALTFVTGVILDDTCVNAGKQVYGQANELSELLECGKTASAASSYGTVWSTLDTTQSGYNAQSYTPAFPLETASGITTDTYSSAAATTNSQHYQRNKDFLLAHYTAFGISSSNCASVADSSRTVLCYVSGISDAATYTSTCGGSTSKDCLQQGLILSAAGMCGASYLVACEHLNYISLELNNNICEDMVKGLINVCVGQAFIGFFYFFVLAVGCLGINRFNSDNSSESAKVAPEPQERFQPTAGNPNDQWKPAVGDPTTGYSAEAAMAATKIQSAQRCKVARKRVSSKRAQHR